MSKKPSYTEEQMLAAVSAVRGGMSKTKAAAEFKVPKTTLLNKLAGRTPLVRKMGRDTYLSQEEECQIVE